MYVYFHSHKTVFKEIFDILMKSKYPFYISLDNAFNSTLRNLYVIQDLSDFFPAFSKVHCFRIYIYAYDSS
jgi:hypothetical protein